MTNDPAKGPGSTNDPNQADKTGPPRRDRFRDVPEKANGRSQQNPEPARGPGTTSDPNQADRT